MIEWISVKDRLPGKDTRNVRLFKLDGVPCVYSGNMLPDGRVYLYGFGKKTLEGFTHWAEINLPEI